MEFLEDMEKRYELVIYTAADPDYADSIINFMEKKHRLFTYRLYNCECIQQRGQCVFKYLDLLCTNRDITGIVIVDNTVHNYALSIRNGVPVKTYKGGDDDKELIYLAGYLRMLATEADVRNRIKEDFAAYLVEHCST